MAYITILIIIVAITITCYLLSKLYSGNKKAPKVVSKPTGLFDKITPEQVAQHNVEMALFKKSTYSVFVNYLYTRYNTEDAVWDRIRDSVFGLNLIFKMDLSACKSFFAYLQMIAADIMSGSMDIDSGIIYDHIKKNCKAYMSENNIDVRYDLSPYFVSDCMMMITGYVLLYTISDRDIVA